MSITLGGIFFIFIILILVFKNRKSVEKEFQCMFLFSIISGLILDVGYIGKIGNTEILFNYLMSIVTFFFAIAVIFKHRGDSNLTMWIALFAIEVCIGAGITIVLNRTYQTVSFQDSWDLYFAMGMMPNYTGFEMRQFVVMFGRIILFMLNISAFKLCCTRKWILNSSNTLLTVSLVILGICAVELFLDNLVSPTLFRNVCYKLFGKSEATYDIPREFQGIYVPMVFGREPSTAAYMYFVFAINAIFLIARKNKPCLSTISLILFLILLTTTATLSSVLYLGVILIAFLLMTKHRLKYITIIAILSVFSIDIIIKLFGVRINNVLNSISLFDEGIGKLTVSSEIVRFYSIYNNLSYFLKSPLFGIGLGVGYSFSGLATTLCNIGILGLILWCGALLSSIKNLQFKKSTLVWALICFFILYAPTSHMGVMTYQDKSFYIFLVLCSLNRNEQLEFTVADNYKTILSIINRINTENTSKTYLVTGTKIF